MVNKSTYKGSIWKPKAKYSREWIPLFTKGGGGNAYGLGGYQITDSVWDYDSTRNISFQSIAHEEMSEPLKALRGSLPGPEIGLQVFPVKMGDEEIAPLLDCLVLYGLKQVVPYGELGIEHACVRILIASDSIDKPYARVLQCKKNFDCAGSNGLVLAAMHWEDYYLYDYYQELVDWNNVIPEAEKGFFTTDGWVHCATEVIP